MFHPNGGFSVLLGVISARAWYNIGLAVVLLSLAVAFYWAYQMWSGGQRGSRSGHGRRANGFL